MTPLVLQARRGAMILRAILPACSVAVTKGEGKNNEQSRSLIWTMATPAVESPSSKQRLAPARVWPFLCYGLRIIFGKLSSTLFARELVRRLVVVLWPHRSPISSQSGLMLVPHCDTSCRVSSRSQGNSMTNLRWNECEWRARP